jgi:ABC-2 type transport system permease protein
VSVSFLRLLGLEIAQILRRPVAWLVLGAVFVAMCAAAANGAARVAETRAEHARLAAEEAAATATVHKTAAALALPSDVKVDYHRDPTDAFGYWGWFLVRHAVDPPAPLAILATGEADVSPSYIRINFSSVFPDADAELSNPRLLRLRDFDMAFVLVFLVPLALIALAAPTLVAERESGILRLVASMPITPLRVAALKYTALTLVSVGALWMSVLAALFVFADFPGVAALVWLAAIVALWAVFWITGTALIASFWRSVAGSVAILTALWALVTIALPAAAALIAQGVYPPPSRIAYVDASRQATDAYDERGNAIRATWLARQPHDPAKRETLLKSPEVRRFARDAFYRAALEPHRRRIDARASVLMRLESGLRLLSPASMLDGALAAAAATDRRRHLEFVAATDSHSQVLRAKFVPLALANVNAPRPCGTCPGRLNFDGYGNEPAFVVLPPRTLATSLGPAAVYLALLCLALIVLAARRLRMWDFEQTGGANFPAGLGPRRSRGSRHLKAGQISSVNADAG